MANQLITQLKAFFHNAIWNCTLHNLVKRKELISSNNVSFVILYANHIAAGSGHMGTYGSANGTQTL